MLSRLFFLVKWIVLICGVVVLCIVGLVVVFMW